MKFTSQQAYRLGSMPHRVLRAARWCRWPEVEFDPQVFELLDEWQELLRRVPDKTLLPEVKACRDWIENQVKAADEKRRKYNRSRHLRGLLGEDAGVSEEPCPDFGGQWVAMWEQLSGLAGTARETGIGQKLPAHLCDLHRLGQLIGQARGGGSSDADETAEIWRIAKRWASEEDLTGQAKGAEAGASIDRLVSNRLSEMDELFSEGEIHFQSGPKYLPEAKASNVVGDQVLTIDEVAQRLQVSVDSVQRLINTQQLKAVAFSGKGATAGKKVVRITPRALEEFLKANAPVTSGDQKRRNKRAKHAPPKDYFA